VFYMPHPSHPPLFDHPNNMWWSVKVMKIFIMQSTPASFHFHLGPNILLSTLFWNTIYFLTLVCENKFHTHTKQEVKLWLCIFLIF
jgi:hypothetical protein